MTGKLGIRNALAEDKEAVLQFLCLDHIFTFLFH